MAFPKSPHWGNKVPVPLGNPTSTLPILDLASVPGGTILFGATNDTLGIIKVPERVCIGSNFAMILGDHDTGANLVLTLRLNNGTIQKTIIDSATTGQTGGIIRPTKSPTVEDAIGFTTDSKLWWIEILVQTGAGGGAQAAIAKVQLDLCGWYPPGAVTE